MSESHDIHTTQSGLSGLLATNLRLLLAYRGMSQRELASRIRKDPNTVSSWARGQNFPPPATLELTASVLGVPTSYLLSPLRVVAEAA